MYVLCVVLWKAENIFFFLILNLLFRNIRVAFASRLQSDDCQKSFCTFSREILELLRNETRLIVNFNLSA